MTEMTEQDERDERIKSHPDWIRYWARSTFVSENGIALLFSRLAASEVARERERIGDQLHALYMSGDDNAVTLLKMENLAQNLLRSPKV